MPKPYPPQATLLACPLGVRYHLHISGVAFPFVLKRLSNTPARPQEPSLRTPDLSRVRPVVSK